MNEYLIYKIILYTWLGLGIPVFILLFFKTAPYGRHIRKGWGPLLNDKLAWWLMELPSPIIFIILFYLSDNLQSPITWLFFLMWEAHYLHRSFIYPLQRRGKIKKMPISIVLFSFLFNTVNSYLNGRWLFHLSDNYSNNFLFDFRFIFGLIIFVTGFVVNRASDRKLQELREPGNSNYKIPKGGLFDLIASPNYLGEIIQWTGWAVVTWSLAGFSFAYWTIVNLAPRAKSNLSWYKKNFSDFPKDRKALIPWLW